MIDRCQMKESNENQTDLKNERLLEDWAQRLSVDLRFEFLFLIGQQVYLYVRIRSAAHI